MALPVVVSVSDAKPTACPFINSILFLINNLNF